MAVELNSTAVNISWSPPQVTNGTLRHYIVYYRADQSEEFAEVIVIALDGVSLQSIVLDMLIEFTSYQIQVSAFTGAGEGTRSSIVSVTTDPDSASPPTFVNVIVVNSTAVEVQIGYPMFPRGKIRGYIIDYGVPDMTLMLQPNTELMRFNYTLDMLNDNSSQSVVINGLSPFTYYVFRVAAFSISDDPFRIHMGIFSADTDAVRTNEDGELNK